MKWLTLLLAVYSIQTFADDLGRNVLYAEDTSMIEASTPLEHEEHLSAKPSDIFLAHVVAIINKSQCGVGGQTMKVFVDGVLTHEWLVSTGREAFEKAKSGRKYVTTTPVGYYRPFKLEENHHSITWDADMPHAVFFNGGIAAHATTHVDQLGLRASGGCVRQNPENAEIFYHLVETTAKSDVAKISRYGKFLKNEEGGTLCESTYDTVVIVENRD